MPGLAMDLSRRIDILLTEMAQTEGIGKTEAMAKSVCTLQH